MNCQASLFTQRYFCVLAMFAALLSAPLGKQVGALFVAFLSLY